MAQATKLLNLVHLLLHTKFTHSRSLAPSVASSAHNDSNNTKQMSTSLSFCRECGNLLYPQEDKESKTLNMRCRNCDFLTVSESTLIYRNELKRDELKSGTKLNDDIIYDCTLPRISKGCPDCESEDAIYFSNRSTSRNADLRLTFVCCQCKSQYSEEDYQKLMLRKNAMETYEDMGL